MIVPIEMIREHLRLDFIEDITSNREAQRENQYLEMLYYGAVDDISSFLEYDITELDKVPSSIKTCILLVIGDKYENRLAQTDKELHTNRAVCNMLQLYRKNIGV